jgi:Ca2+-binding EF-hand superfamily protein
MKKIMIISALACMALWATDFSQMSTEELMNMRGTVSLDERPAFQQEMQKRMQTLTPEERQKYMGMGQGQGMINRPSFSEFDLNGDGVVPQEEFEKARAERMKQNAESGKMMKNAGNAPAFSDIDANDDDNITLREFEQHQAEQMQQKMGTPPPAQ